MFYNDLYRIFDAAGLNLEVLSGKQVLYDRSGRLRPAGKNDGTVWAGVFVRMGNRERRRNSGGAPLPPSTLTRRYRFLDERITIRQEDTERISQSSSHS